MTERMTPAKFGVDETVRFIGTDTIQTVRQYNAETLEYQVQRGNEEASVVWVSGIYLELVEPSKRPAIGTALLRRNGQYNRHNSGHHAS